MSRTPLSRLFFRRLLFGRLLFGRLLFGRIFLVPSFVVLGSLLAVFTSSVAMADDGPFTLEQIMSAPFPSGLVASPTGGKLAWVMTERGVRNIWVAEPSDYGGHAITSYTEDDGQVISQLTFSPDGARIAYVRGGGANRRGEIPNPLSDPAGAEQAIWIMEAAGGEPEQLAEGYSPTFSPQGNGLAFVKAGQIWWIDLEEGEEKEEGEDKGEEDEGGPKQLIKARGSCSSLRWSPDGKRLAFVSNRGRYSFIGVFNTESKEVQYLDPGVDQDFNPAWSPESDRLAFIRIPSRKEPFIFTPQREVENPWSVRIADLESGESWELWQAEKGSGSAFRAIVARNQIFWGAGNRIVFPWERDGWTHLYSVVARDSVGVKGGEPRLLTPGSFEVEHVSLSPDGKFVLYASNQDDIDRRHLWRVDVKGATPQAITNGVGIEWSPESTSDGASVAFLASGTRRPAHPEIIQNNKTRRDLAPGSIPATFPEQQLVEPQQVIFSAADGMPIHGQLFLPKEEYRGRRRPAMLYFHGGSRRQMLLGWHYSNYYHNCYAMNQFLASRGYVVLSVNYRSGIGYGMEFREAIDYGAAGASEFNDVLGAGLYLRSRDDVHPERIGLWGGSYGGYLTAMGLARASDLFAAGVDIHGAHDWNIVIENFVPSYDPLRLPEIARLAWESSPMNFIDNWRSPVLLIHGDDDRNVPFTETVDLVEALRRRGVPFEQLIFPDEVHGFLLHSSWLRAFKTADDFLSRRLKGKSVATQGGLQ